MHMNLKRTTIYFAATLIATGAVATYATATTPTPQSTEQVRNLDVAPYANLTNSKQLLLYVSQAERLVQKGDRTFAKMHLNEALSMAARLPSSPGTQEDSNIYRVTMVSLNDGTVQRQLMLAQPSNITEALNFSPDAIPVAKNNIADADVKYITSKWEKSKILVTLNNALRAIEMGKTNEVQAQFAKLHDLLIVDNTHTVSPRRAAQDNVALARVLLQAGAYDAAKLALARADTSIQAVAKDNSASSKRFEEIAIMRNEMADVHKVIERNEPDSYKKLDAKLEKWWNALS